MTAWSDRAGADADWWSCGEMGASHLPGVVCPGFAALWLSMTSALYTAEDQWNKGQMRVFCLSAVCLLLPPTSSDQSFISVFFPPKIFFFQWLSAKLHESVQEREFVASSKMYLSLKVIYFTSQWAHEVSSNIVLTKYVFWFYLCVPHLNGLHSNYCFGNGIPRRHANSSESTSDHN